MSGSHVLIVAVDGLRASALGAYGNTTYPTPALDRFAAESFLLDGCFAPSAELAAVYRALWQSIHPLRGAAAGEATKADSSLTLPGLMAQSGYATTLLADDAAVLALPTARDFQDCIQVSEIANDAQPAGTGHFSDQSNDQSSDSTAKSTSLERTFAAAGELVASAEGRRPQLLWVHARGPYGPWDAPLEWQQSLLDEDDPPPLSIAQPPDRNITETDDPDTSFRFACAYAAQVMVLDACWDGLMSLIGRGGNAKGGGDAGGWMVMLIGVRGFPLGEHGRIGGVDERLYAEQLHVPWLVRLPDGRGRMLRRGQLVTHLDLLPTLVDWLGKGASQEPRVKSREPDNQMLSSPGARLPSYFDGQSLLPLIGQTGPPWRETLLSVASGGRLALRTAGWSLRQEASDAQSTAAANELYVRPDDRWEANDVASRCGDVAEGLADIAEEISQGLSRGEPMPAILLPDELKSTPS